MFPSAGWSRPRSYGVRRSAMIEARSSCRSPWPAGQVLDVLLGDAQLRGLIAARRLDPLGRLANALGRGALDDRDGGGRPHSPVELPLLGATAGAADLSAAGPGGLVESGPELHTELSPPSAGVHRIPRQQGRHPKSVVFAPNSTPWRRRDEQSHSACVLCRRKCQIPSQPLQLKFVEGTTPVHYCPTFSAPQQHLRVWGTRWRGRREQLHQWTAVEQVELENS